MNKPSKIVDAFLILSSVACFTLFAALGFVGLKSRYSAPEPQGISRSPQANFNATLPTYSAIQSKLNNSREVIMLTEDNMVTLDQAFDDNSVTQAMVEMKRLSDKAPKGSTLYLVLNTPGGSVDAGLKLISFLKALPQKVKTLTIFAASMGFQTVQNLDERLILESGTLMSHRATFGVQGQGPGEIFSRLKYIMSMIDSLDSIAAARMNITFDAYRKMIHDEYWAYGENATRENAADRTVVARCGKGLDLTKKSRVDTIFGRAEVEMSKCPLMPGIISMSVVRSENGDRDKVTKYAKLMLTDRNKFLRDFVMTNRTLEYQK